MTTGPFPIPRCTSFAPPPPPPPPWIADTVLSRNARSWLDGVIKGLSLPPIANLSPLSHQPVVYLLLQLHQPLLLQLTFLQVFSPRASRGMGKASLSHPGWCAWSYQDLIMTRDYRKRKLVVVRLGFFGPACSSELRASEIWGWAPLKSRTHRSV